MSGSSTLIAAPTDAVFDLKGVKLPDLSAPKQTNKQRYLVSGSTVTASCKRPKSFLLGNVI